MANIVGYARVSTLRQVEEGEGLAIQRERIQAWGEFQRLPIEVIESDDGISGSHDHNRPAFQRALRRALQLGHEGIFVVYKLDRMGRDSIDMLSNLEMLRHVGVRVVAVADSIDSKSGMGETMLSLLLSILAAFAEMEKDNIRQRLVDGRRKASAENRRYSLQPEYGRKPVPSALRDGKFDLVPAEDELRAVARIRELHAQGMSFRAIGKALLEEDIRPRRAAAWAPIVVQRIAIGKRPARTAPPKPRVVRLIAETLAAKETQ